jgi:hypothetical protein
MEGWLYRADTACLLLFLLQANVKMDDSAEAQSIIVDPKRDVHYTRVHICECKTYGSPAHGDISAAYT